jgi:putative membrane protein
MKIVIIAAAVAGLFATSASAQSIGEKTGINSLTGTAPSTQDFITQAAISDMFEVQSSQLAKTNGADDKSKAFADKMVKDHTETTNELKGLVSGGKVKAELPTALDKTHQSKLDKLKGLKGADFDKQYDSDQLAGHKDAVSLFDRYSKGGDNADLKAFAAKTLPHLEEHLKMAQDLGTNSSSSGTMGSK